MNPTALVVLKAAVERLGTTASVSVSAIALAYEIGEWLIHYRRVDPISVADGTGVLGQMFLSFFKTKTDNAVLADDVSQEFVKGLRHIAGLSDDQIMAFFKTLADPAVVQDAKALYLQKPLNELVANTEDHAYLLTKKVKEDIVGLSDAKLYVFFKALLHVAGASDALANSFSKPTSDGYSVADAYASFLTKIVSDSINVTDDVDGAASIQDDQEMQFTKSVTDIAGVSDEIYIIIEVLREFFDTAAVSDLVALGFSKPVADVAEFTDDQTNQFNKGLFEIPAFQDFLIRNSAKALLDNANITDLRAMATSAVKTDSFQSTDTGTVQCQSYGADYFAEDYVGVFRSF